MTPIEINLLSRLREAVASRIVTQTEIQHKTGVDQSQISRILKGKNKRSSENVQILCKFAQELPAELPADVQPNDEAFQLLTAIMDGSPNTQRAVTHLLRNFLTLKRQYENDAKRST